MITMSSIDCIGPYTGIPDSLEVNHKTQNTETQGTRHKYLLGRL